MLGTIIRTFNQNTTKLVKPEAMSQLVRNISTKPKSTDIKPDFYNLVSNDKALAGQVGEVASAECHAGLDSNGLSSTAHMSMSAVLFTGNVVAVQLIADYSFADLVSGGYFA